jgi:hypothetical protein
LQATELMERDKFGTPDFVLELRVLDNTGISPLLSISRGYPPKWYETDSVKPIVERVYPFGDATGALRHLIEDRPFGKVVLAG